MKSLVILVMFQFILLCFNFNFIPKFLFIFHLQRIRLLNYYPKSFLKQMEKASIVSSYHSQNQQIQISELPLHRISQRKQVDQKSFTLNNNKISPNKLQKIILNKLTEVQYQNKKLLQIARKISNTSLVFSNHEKLHQVVIVIQQQMKMAFNELIESIQEFYIDIDSKIKEIGAYISSLSGTEASQTSMSHEDYILPSNQQQKSLNLKEKQQGILNQKQTLKIINQKIQLLQKDLDQTKSNEKKLMTIIQKLILKYELSQENTIIREDPFLKNKMMSAGRITVQSEGNINTKNMLEQYSVQNSGRFMQANTFAKHIHYPQHSATQSPIQPKKSFVISNVIKNPQRINQQQNPNDYSIYQELNKIDQYSQKNKNYNSNIDQSLLKRKILEKNTSKLADSTISVHSYAFSNSIRQEDQEPCFIRKLYSKKNTSLGKLSLKNCTQPNTVFQFNKSKEQNIDQSNKNHRQTFLLNQLKR